MHLFLLINVDLRNKIMVSFYASSLFINDPTMYFIGRVTLSRNRIWDHHGIFTLFFKNPDVIFSSNTVHLNASIKDFTAIHLVTFSI